jgi:23S rRNA (pseudouridine1915-N3)-methyltransferase
MSVGKASDALGQAQQAEYEKRLSKWAAVTWQLISHDGSKEAESRLILKHLKPADFVVLLDERGQQPDNEALVADLEKWLMSGRQIVFVIGGAYGVDRQVFDRADYVWSFSKLVFPHQLMRVLLLEQLYRTFSLRDGRTYHHK